MLSLLSPFYCAHCIHCRLPTSHCVCEQIQSIDMPFPVMICSHPKEWQKNDNTAQWATLSSPQISRIKWHRKVELIDSEIAFDSVSTEEGQYLLYPSEEAEDIKDVHPNIKKLWVIDGTWQESQKMLRQSPWLKKLAKVKINTEHDTQLISQFKLRRNQRGLSTMEAIACASAGHSKIAAAGLNNNFNLFQNTLLKLIK